MIIFLGEPNDSGNNEDCATVWTNGRWNDVPCNGYSYGSICELGKGIFTNYVNTLHSLKKMKYSLNTNLFNYKVGIFNFTLSYVM